MGILSRISKRFPLTLKSRQSIYFDKKTGKPKTIIATGGTGGGGGMGGSTTRSEATLKQYRAYYEGDGTVFAAINTTAWNAVMVGYELTSQNEEAKKIVQETFDRIDLNSFLLDNVVYALIYGDSFIEMVKSGKEIVSLMTVDPITMNINYDEKGTLTGYQQKIGGMLQKTILKPEDILHLKFFSNPTNPYGMSLIEPSRGTIDRKIDTDEALANAILRHGTPKYKVRVGTDQEIPPPEIFIDIKNELEDLTSLNEIIIPGLVDIEVLDEKGVPGIEAYSNLFQTQLVIGMLCPEEALGLGQGSTEATAKIKEVMYERFVRSIQMKISDQIRHELIDQILETNGIQLEEHPENVVRMRFNSVTDADEAVKSKWLGNLNRGYMNTKKPFTINEVRAMFGYAPIEGGDELEGDTQPEEGQEEEPKEEENEDEGNEEKENEENE